MLDCFFGAEVKAAVYVVAAMVALRREGVTNCPSHKQFKLTRVQNRMFPRKNFLS